MQLYKITFRYKGDTMTTEVKADNKDQARQRLVNYNEVDEVLEVEEIGMKKTIYTCQCGKQITDPEEAAFFEEHGECLSCDHVKGDQEEILEEDD